LGGRRTQSPTHGNQCRPFRQTPPDDKIRITIEEAVRDFLADEKVRQLAKTTTCQSRTLFQEQLLPWARSQSLVFLNQLTTPKLREFRASWNNSALTSQRKHHRLNSFFDFYLENEWVIRNRAIRVASGRRAPRSSFVAAGSPLV
jgi:site-specific recombinase XerD